MNSRTESSHCPVKRPPGLWSSSRRKRNNQPASFLSAAQPTDQGEESVVLLLVVVGGLGELFSDLPCALKMGASRENFSSKSVYPEKLKLKLSMNSEANAADQKGSLSCFFIPPLRRQKKSGKEALSFPCGNQEMREGGGHTWASNGFFEGSRGG